MDEFRVSDLPPRLARKVRVNPVTGCWEWTSGRPDRYGQVWWTGRNRLVHVVVYELLVGTVPGGLQLDHVYERGCRSRACCWPVHLEPVTAAENMRRAAAVREAKTHCPQGHPYDDENTIRYRSWQYCKSCRRERATCPRGHRLPPALRGQRRFCLECIRARVAGRESADL
ncbi:MAG: HNH endonuclease signature motif containing protein [Actinocrinis sp.]